VVITNAKFSVFYRTVSPLTTKILGMEGNVNTSVSIANTAVSPGHLVIGDADGVVFISPELARPVLEEARKRQEREIVMRSELDRGISLSALSGAQKYRSNP
jgi:4-hydroxy-4-methyl-2-oxoglutarate aldolase